MRVIRDSHEWIKRHLVIQPKKNRPYRPIKFLVCHKMGNGILLYNVATGCLLHLDEGKIKDDDLDDLIKMWFYVPNDFNEYDWIEFLRSKLLMHFQNRPIQSYTIMTTLDCNARCFYCYEKGVPKITMSPKIASEVADFIIRNDHRRTQNIRWFGGEPLLNYPVIDLITEKLTANNISFSSSLITNALLLNKELISKASNNWNVKRVQITIDGTEEIYCKSKAFVNSNGSEYQTVLNNIESTLEAGIKVNIRLNQDLHNTEDLINLTDFLQKRFGEYPSFSVYNILLYGERDKLSQRLRYDCFLKLRKKIEEMKLISDYQLSKQLRVNQCMADGYSSVVITPNGQLGKCEHYYDKNMIGTIRSSKFDPDVLRKWRKREETNEKCFSCPIYPVCIRIEMCTNNYGECEDYHAEEQLRQMKLAMLSCYKSFNESNANL